MATAALPITKPRIPPALEPLRRVRRIGLILLSVQLAGFLIWSSILYSRFALTGDFSINYQAWFLIAHGHLDPFNSVQQIPYWRTHSEFVMWPLALFYWVWPHAVTLLWLQDLAITGAEAVVFTWLCEIAGRRRQGTEAAWLAGCGLTLLVANPWIWWSVSFDFHTETMATLFAILLARDLAKGRRRAWVWVLPLLSCGDVASTYMAGVGLGGVLAGHGRRRLSGAVLVAAGAGATLLITHLHGNFGSGHGLQSFRYLAGVGPSHAPMSLGSMALGIITHPSGLLGVLWGKRVDILANLAPAGLVGICEPTVLPLALAVLLANNMMKGVGFAEPVFQYLPVYVFLPVGTVAVLGRLTRRHRRVGMLLAGLLAAQAVGWAVVWVPRVPTDWLRVPVSTAAALARLESRIPGSAHVIISQGVMGRFADRTQLGPLPWRQAVPVGPGETWVVVTPLAGLEEESTASAAALIGDLAGPLHATLVMHAHGVWAFRWRRPPSGMHALAVPSGFQPLSAWTEPMASDTAGRAITTVPMRAWHVTSSGAKGYVSDGLAWQESPGRYQALVRLSTTGPINVEIWNDTGHVLLARRSIPATIGQETVVLSVNASTTYSARLYSGWGPFRANFVPPPPGNRLEVRVWSPGGHAVNVYSAALIRKPGT